MDLTAQDFIVDALSLIGATQMDQVPPAWEMNKALRALNHMLNTWSSERLMVRAMTRESFTLVDGTASYTIGSGADFDTAKPLKIDSAYIQDSNGYDHQLGIVEMARYNAFADKTTEGLPDCLAYDPGASQQATQAGTIYLWHVPGSAYTLYISSQKFLTEFSALTTTFTFEPQYGEAIKYNLATRLWRFYRKPTENIPADIVGIAASTKRNIKAINATQPRCKIDIPGCRGTYNIYTDE